MIEIRPARSKRVRRSVDEPLQDCHFDLQQGYPSKIMIWACMSSRGLSKLCIVEGNMDSDKYINVMETHLLPQAAQWFPCGDWVYQQDGARCHTSRKTMNFFAENNVEVLPWCPNSPDLNPIENVWGLLKEKVHKKAARTKAELVANLHAIINDTEYWSTICRNLIESMPRRLQKLKMAKGGLTKSKKT